MIDYIWTCEECEGHRIKKILSRAYFTITTNMKSPEPEIESTSDAYGAVSEVSYECADCEHPVYIDECRISNEVKKYFGGKT